MKQSSAAIAALSLAWALTAPAQQAPVIPIRQVTPAVSTDSGVLSLISGLRALPRSRVMVHDFIRRRIIIFDESLKRFTTVMDSAAGAPANYGTSMSPGLIPWLADSTLVIDRSSTAFIVIDPEGKLGGILSPPKASDLFAMGSGLLDPRGRLVYRGYRRPAPSRTAPAPQPPPVAGVPQILPGGPDSAAIVRGDFDARSVDTIAIYHVQPTRTVMVRLPPTTSGMVSSIGTGMFNPLPLLDEWTLLPDGTVAIVRAQDYHVDWITMDGKMTSTPKMPFEWKRLTLEDKQHMIDSIRAAYDSKPDSTKDKATMSDGSKINMPFMVVEPAELPDYYPPVRIGQVKADNDGNLWVLPATSTASMGGLLFDVINRKGEVFERVQLPPNRNLIGFGSSGVLYLSPPPVYVAGIPPQTTLERVQVIRPNASVIKP